MPPTLWEKLKKIEEIEANLDSAKMSKASKRRQLCSNQSNFNAGNVQILILKKVSSKNMV
jgi:hypothetical protein